jgi:S1-C subfamily serine protease
MGQPGADSKITLVVDPGQKNEKSYSARVVRKDRDLDLALLRVEGRTDSRSWLSATTTNSRS